MAGEGLVCLEENIMVIKRRFTSGDGSDGSNIIKMPLPPKRIGYPWEILDLVHSGKVDEAEAMINSIIGTLSQAEELLLRGIISSWRQQYSAAKNQLLFAAEKGDEATVYWSFLMLADTYLDQGDDLSAHYYILRAPLYVHQNKEAQPYLLVLTELITARADIERGILDRAENRLKMLDIGKVDAYFKGMVHYLLGASQRFNTDQQTAISNLQEAIKIFDEVSPNPYRLAMAKLQLSYCAIQPARALKFAQEAQAIFISLARNRESEYAQIQQMALEENLDNKVISRTNNGYLKVKNCLFISQRMQQLHIKAAMYAKMDTHPILILGDRGSGKERLAEAIHAMSPRAKKEMVTVNCAAISMTLLESELFGHEKGSFTGANVRKEGHFEAANGTTLFLDEIGQLPLEAQGKLLRVLEYRTFMRVGGTKEVGTNARIILATNRNLKEESEKGNFLPDLYDRIRSLTLNLPCLNDRREEIIPLAEIILEQLPENEQERYTLDRSAQNYLYSRDYPGNIRELKGVLLQAIANARIKKATRLTSTLFPLQEMVQLSDEETKTGPLQSIIAKIFTPPTDRERIIEMDEAKSTFEKEYLTLALSVCEWDKTEAYKLLNMNERSFYRVIEKYKMYGRPSATK